MDITVSARHMDISTALRTAAEAKLGRLGRFRDDLRAEVHFYEEQNPRIADKEVCEVSLEGAGRLVRAKAAAADPFAAIDLVVEKVEQQLRRLKTKQILRNHGPRRAAAAVGAEDLDLDLDIDLQN